MNVSKSKVLYLFLGVLFIARIMPAQAKTNQDKNSSASPSMYPTKIAAEIKIDGVLDEPVWKTVLKVSDYKTNMPDYGKDLSVKTETYLAYDADNLYFAFKCYEPDPSKIKGAVTGRDKMINDDWVCINLDSFGDQQTLYAIYVNPYGIQGDSRATRTNEDFKFDLLWDCASVIDNEGYTVEMKIPVKSLRFAETSPVVMRVLLQRNLVLRNEQGTYPAMDPSKGDDWLTQTAPLVYEGLNNHKLLEILPALTYSYKENANEGALVKEESKGKLSLTGKYGITQDLTLDATYNPDFSQVEADAGKVDVNLRYQLYYPEARSFFKEGSENFYMSIGPTIIHTRRIVNPIFGAKLAGQISTGHTIAALYARDEFESINGQTDKYTDYGFIRYKGDLGNSSYLGGVIGAKELSNFHNRIAGVDGYIRTSAGGGISIFGSYSSLDDKINSIDNNGHSIQASYLENSRTKRINVGFSKISEFYDSQLGLMDRTGILNFYAGYGPVFYPESDIFLSIRPSLSVDITRDDPSGIWENGIHFSATTFFVNRIVTGIGIGTNREVFLGNKFNVDYANFSVSYQLANELFFSLNYGMRNAIYYSATPYQGYAHSGSGSFIYQPFSNLDFTGSLTYTDFYRDSNKEKIYDYLILRLKTTYQLNKYLFLRGIIESNSFRKTLLTDVLLSYTYIPGTVIYLGYGSFYEKVEWKTDRYLQANNYMETKRGFFFKASYLWRL